MKTTYVFSQLVSIALDCNHFNNLSRKYEEDKYVKHFTYWSQLLVMMFGHSAIMKVSETSSMQ